MQVALRVALRPSVIVFRVGNRMKGQEEEIAACGSYIAGRGVDRRPGVPGVARGHSLGIR